MRDGAWGAARTFCWVGRQAIPHAQHGDLVATNELQDRHIAVGTANDQLSGPRRKGQEVGGGQHRRIDAGAPNGMHGVAVVLHLRTSA